MDVLGKTARHMLVVGVAMAFVVGCSCQTSYTQATEPQFSSPVSYTTITSLAAGDALGMGTFANHHEALARANNPVKPDEFLVDTMNDDFSTSPDDTHIDSSN